MKLACVASFTSKKAESRDFWNGGLRTASLIGPLAHCALSIPRLDLHVHLIGESPELLLQEAVRLAILIFIAALKDAFGLTAAELTPLMERFELAISLRAHVSCFPELRLWANMVCMCLEGSSLSKGQELEVRRAMAELRLVHSEEAISKAKEVIWIPHLFDTNIDTAKIQIDQQHVIVLPTHPKLQSSSR